MTLKSRIALLACFVFLQAGFAKECLPPPESQPVEAFRIYPLFGGRKFDKPVQSIQAPLGREANLLNIWWIVLHKGKIIEVHTDGSGARVVLDISSRVQMGAQWGLQEIALAPQFPKDPRAFVTYVGYPQANTTQVYRSILASYRYSVEQHRFDPDSEQILLSEPAEQPWHLIGGIRFGPDGYLYVGWGESTFKSQLTESYAGKILRLDISDTRNGYRIPPGNPFKEGPFKAEVYAIGLRNPWRFSFHPDTQQLLVNDVGASLYEEINLVEAGKNYGWPAMEGNSCTSYSHCEPEKSVLPLKALDHSQTCAIVGGAVYKGNALEGLKGKYLFVDHCFGVYSLDMESGAINKEIRLYLQQLATLDLDIHGEPIIASAGETKRTPQGNDYQIYGIEKNPDFRSEHGAAPNAQYTLSGLGCFDKKTKKFSPSLMNYSLNFPPWENGEEITRKMNPHIFQMPPYGLMDFPRYTYGHLFLKTFLSNKKPVMTQMSVFRESGWSYHEFKWNADGTDAVLQPDNSAACTKCHLKDLRPVIGASFSQLDSPFGGPGRPSQILSLHLTPGGPGKTEYERFSSHGKNVSVEKAAREYLHVNCAHCHRKGGAAEHVNMHFGYRVPVDEMKVCNQPAIGSERKRLVPGHPEDSEIIRRLTETGPFAMPPGRDKVDIEGVKLLTHWILEMKSCPTAKPRPLS